jgi:hypothetical protein
MTIRNSPHARTPPVNLPNIPGVTKGATDKVKKPKSNEPNGTNEHDGTLVLLLTNIHRYFPNGIKISSHNYKRVVQ